jgi:multiple sugar transport system permease protein
MVLTTEKQAAQIAGPGSGPGPAAKRKRKINLVPYGFLSPTILLIVVLMLIPIVMVIWYSLMDNVITKKNPKFVGFSNYAEVLGSETFHTAILNTVFFTTVSVAAHLVLGLTFAMLLNTRFLKSFTKAIFRVIYVMPWLFTVAIIAILWRLLLSPNGIVNFLVMELGLSSTSIEWLASRDTALLAVTFINIWAGYPFFMVSLLAGLQGIPKDLYEAARVDGANPVQQFISITLPQLRPIIISMALLDLIWTSQQFALIWMTTGGGPISSTEMLSTFTYKLAFSEYNFSMAAASAVIILAFSMVLAFFYVRYQKARD